MILRLPACFCDQSSNGTSTTGPDHIEICLDTLQYVAGSRMHGMYRYYVLYYVLLAFFPFHAYTHLFYLELQVSLILSSSGTRHSALGSDSTLAVLLPTPISRSDSASIMARISTLPNLPTLIKRIQDLFSQVSRHHYLLLRRSFSLTMGMDPNGQQHGKSPQIPPPAPVHTTIPRRLIWTNIKRAPYIERRQSNINITGSPSTVTNARSVAMDWCKGINRHYGS